MERDTGSDRPPGFSLRIFPWTAHPHMCLPCRWPLSSTLPVSSWAQPGQGYPRGTGGGSYAQELMPALCPSAQRPPALPPPQQIKRAVDRTAVIAPRNKVLEGVSPESFKGARCNILPSQCLGHGVLGQPGAVREGCWGKSQLPWTAPSTIPTHFQTQTCAQRFSTLICTHTDLHLPLCPALFLPTLTHSCLCYLARIRILSQLVWEL